MRGLSRRLIFLISLDSTLATLAPAVLQLQYLKWVICCCIRRLAGKNGASWRSESNHSAVPKGTSLVLPRYRERYVLWKNRIQGDLTYTG